MSFRNFICSTHDRSDNTGLVQQQRFTCICTSWILGAEKHEVWVWLDGLLELRDKELPIIIQQAVQSLQNICRRQVELIKDDPVAVPDCPHQGTLMEH